MLKAAPPPEETWSGRVFWSWRRCPSAAIRMWFRWCRIAGMKMPRRGLTSTPSSYNSRKWWGRSEWKAQLLHFMLFQKYKCVWIYFVCPILSYRTFFFVQINCFAVHGIKLFYSMDCTFRRDFCLQFFFNSWLYFRTCYICNSILTIVWSSILWDYCDIKISLERDLFWCKLK